MRPMLKVMVEDSESAVPTTRDNQTVNLTESSTRSSPAHADDTTSNIAALEDEYGQGDAKLSGQNGTPPSFAARFRGGMLNRRKCRLFLGVVAVFIPCILLPVIYFLIVPNLIRGQVESLAMNKVQVDYLRISSITSDSLHFDVSTKIPKQSWVPFQIRLKAMKARICARDKDLAYMDVPEFEFRLNRLIEVTSNLSLRIPSEIRSSMIEFIQTLSSRGISGDKWVITAPLTIKMSGITWYKNLVVKKEIMLPEMKSTLESLWSALPDSIKIATGVYVCQTRYYKGNIVLPYIFAVVESTHGPSYRIPSLASKSMPSITGTHGKHERSMPPFVQPISFLPPVSIRSLKFIFTERGPALNTLVVFENPTVVSMDLDEIRFRVAIEDTWLGDMFVRNFSLQRGWNNLNVTAGVNLDTKHLSNETVRAGLMVSAQKLFSDIITRMSSNLPAMEQSFVKLSMMGPIYAKHPSREQHAAFIHEVTEPLNILLPLDEILNSVNTHWISNAYASLDGIARFLSNSSVKMRAGSNIELGLQSMIHSVALPEILFPYKFSVFVGSSFDFSVDGFYLTNFGTSMKLDTKFWLYPRSRNDVFTNVVNSYLGGNGKSLAFTMVQIEHLGGSVLGWSGILSAISLSIPLPRPLDMDWLVKAFAAENSTKDIFFDALEILVSQQNEIPGFDVTIKWDLRKVFERWGSSQTWDIVIQSMEFAFDISGTMIMKVNVPREIVFNSRTNNVIAVSFKTQLVESVPARSFQRAVNSFFRDSDVGAVIGIKGFKVGTIDIFDRIRLPIPITQLGRVIGTLLDRARELFVRDKMSAMRIEILKVNVMSSKEIEVELEASVISRAKIFLELDKVTFSLLLNGKQFVSVTVGPIRVKSLASRASPISGSALISLGVALTVHDGNDEALALDVARLVEDILDQNFAAWNGRIAVSGIIFHSHGTRPGIYCLKDVHFPLVGLPRLATRGRQKHRNKFITWDPSKSPAVIDISPLLTESNLEPILGLFKFDEASISTAPNHQLSCSVGGSSQRQSPIQLSLPFFRFSMYLNRTNIVTAGVSSLLSPNGVDSGSRFSLKATLSFNELQGVEMETIQDRVAMVGNWILDRVRDPGLEYMVIEFKDIAFGTRGGLADSNSLFRYTNISIRFRTLFDYEPDLVASKDALKRHVKRLIAAQNVKSLNGVLQALDPSFTRVSLDLLPQRKAIIGFSGSLKDSLIPVNADIGYIRGSFSLGSSSSWLNATSRTGIKVLFDSNTRQDFDCAIDLEVRDLCLGREAQPRPGFFALCGIELGYGAQDRITALRKLRVDLNMTGFFDFIDYGRIIKEIDEVVGHMAEATTVKITGGKVNVTFPTELVLSFKQLDLGFDTENDISLSLASIVSRTPVSSVTVSGTEEITLGGLNLNTRVLFAFQKARLMVNIPFAEFTTCLDDKFLWKTRLAGLRFDTAVASEMNTNAVVKFNNELIAQTYFSQFLQDLSGSSHHGHRLVLSGWAFGYSHYDGDRIDVARDILLPIPMSSVLGKMNTLFGAIDLGSAFDGFELQELSLTTLPRRRLRVHAYSSLRSPLATFAKIPFMEFTLSVGTSKVVEVSMNDLKLEPRNATYMTSTVVFDLQFVQSTEQGHRDMANFLGHYMPSLFDVIGLADGDMATLTLTCFRFGNNQDSAVKLLSQLFVEIPLIPSLDSSLERMISNIMDGVQLPMLFSQAMSPAGVTQTRDTGYVRKFHLELIDEGVIRSNFSLVSQLKGTRLNLNVGYSAVTVFVNDVTKPLIGISVADHCSVVSIGREGRTNLQLSGVVTHLYDSPEARTAFARAVKYVWRNEQPTHSNADVQYVGLAGLTIGSSSVEDDVIDIFSRIRSKVSWISLQPRLQAAFHEAAEKTKIFIQDTFSGSHIVSDLREFPSPLEIDIVHVDYIEAKTIRLETSTRVNGLSIDDLDINVPFFAALMSLDPDTQFPSVFSEWPSFEGYKQIANINLADTRMTNGILKTTIDIIPNDNFALWQHLIGDIAGDIIFRRNIELLQFITTNLTISNIQMGTSPNKLTNALTKVAIDFGLRGILHPLAGFFEKVRPIELGGIQAQVTHDGVACQIVLTPFKGLFKALVIRDIPSATGYLYFRRRPIMRVDMSDFVHRKGGPLQIKLHLSPQVGIDSALTEAIPRMLRFEDFAKDTQLGGFYFHRTVEAPQDISSDPATLNTWRRVMIRSARMYLQHPVVIVLQHEQMLSLALNVRIPIQVPLNLDIGHLEVNLSSFVQIRGNPLRLVSTDGISSALLHVKGRLPNFTIPRKCATPFRKIRHHLSWNSDTGTVTTRETGVSECSGLLGWSRRLCSVSSSLAHGIKQCISILCITNFRAQTAVLDASERARAGDYAENDRTEMAAIENTGNNLFSKTWNKGIDILLNSLLHVGDMAIDIKHAITNQSIEWLNQCLAQFANHVRRRRDAAAFIRRTWKRFRTCTFVTWKKEPTLEDYEEWKRFCETRDT